MTDKEPRIFESPLQREPTPAELVIIPPCAQTAKQDILAPIRSSSHLRSTLLRSLELGSERYGSAEGPSQPNASPPCRGELRVALERSIGAENIPLRRPKRQKLGHMCNETLGEIEPLYDGLSDSPAFKKSASELKIQKPRKPPRKMDGKVNQSLKGKVKKPTGTTAVTVIDKPTQSSSGERELYSSCKKSGDNHEAESEDLHLEGATKRRNEWTPNKGTEAASIDLTGSPASSQSIKSKVKTKDFGSLMSGFNFAGGFSVEEEADSQLEIEQPTTKRLLEIMAQHCSIPNARDSEISETGTSSTEEKSKSKPTRKAKLPTRSKITTITSLSTGRYESPVESVDTGISLASDSNANSDRQPRTAPKRKTTKSKPGKSNVSKVDSRTHLKLAPTVDALKTLGDQTLLFGTSSQLERDSFSGSHGQGHELTSKSWAQGIDDRADSPFDGSSINSGVSRLSRSKNLWGASSRDLHGSLMGVEVIDLVDSNTPRIIGSSASCDKANSSGFGNLVLDETEKSTNSGLQASDTDKTENLEGMGYVDDQNCPNRSVAKGKSSDLDDMPKYQEFSDAKLAHDLAAFGFKPPKKREKMIELLEKCWKSKNRKINRTTVRPTESESQPISSLLSDLPGTNSPSAIKPVKGLSDIPTPNAIDPKSVKGKSSSQKTAKLKQTCLPSRTLEKPESVNSQHNTQSNAIEIDSSTDESIPRSTKSSNPQTSANTDRSLSVQSYDIQKATSKPDQISAKSLQDGATANDHEDHFDLLSQITSAIKAQPRMRSINSVKQPTWHEKILMYDPIWLDDLTRWLNVEGFKRIGEDREVYPSLEIGDAEYATSDV